jgi:glyoxylase-like metal-dependent hydrolase (beta-lactamase superfamily II)
MQVKMLRVGVLQTNCFVLWGADDAAVIDPGGDPEVVIKTLRQSRGKLSHIILTHGHADHVAAAAALQRATGAKIAMHPEDGFLLQATADPMARSLGLRETIPLDKPLEAGQVFKLGGEVFTVLHTPGHTPGSCCLYNEKGGVLFSGDTLFAGSIGRSDLTGGNPELLARSLSILKVLPEETRVYPGHGQETTIGQERQRNRFW